MKIYSKINENPDLSLALGYFDGVHRGHRKVIKKAVDYAKIQGKKSAVITFKDHPCCFFYNVCPKYILTRDERRNKIEELGIDFLYELSFDDIYKLNAREYLEDILIKNFSPIAISTGFNHHFGCKKSGDTEFLQQMSAVHNYIYFMSEPEKIKGEIISSTAIRNLLSEGNIEEANKMLGYNFVIEGNVEYGEQLGRQIGFRTANLLYPPELIELPFGVYATNTIINGKSYKGITNFGIRPTVSTANHCTVETHILDFDKNIYGQKIRVEFLKMIRHEKKFSSIEELKNQIKDDINSI